jgi:adenylate cyclase
MLPVFGRILWGGAKRQDLPDRIRDNIRQQQQDSEKLIGWIQLTIVIAFSILYAVSPAAFTINDNIQLVPYILPTYFLFTVIRLFLVYRHRLPGWFIGLSVIADIALLMITIWSFHLQYGQPPSFYLKAPTLLYIFIFIALRALRFEARYVILAGTVSAIGWIMMFLYVILVEPGNPMITRDYVQYLTTNSILIGGEIDKIISILMVTGILALAISRARGLLVRSVAEGETARTLSRFFAPAVIEQMASAEKEVSLGQGIEREAAILRVDLRSFTPFSKDLSPNDLICLVIDYQSRMVPIILKYNGVIDRFEGDGIMASFGSVSESKTYAADVLHATSELIEAADDWYKERKSKGLEPINIVIAVTTGTIIFGIIGDEQRLEYTILGDCVNVAAKIEKHTKEEKVRALASAEVIERAQEQGYDGGVDQYRTLPDRAIEGIEYKMDLVVLAEQIQK